MIIKLKWPIRWPSGCSTIAPIAIGHMEGPTTPQLRVCSNRPHGHDNVATRVPLHDLASRSPSAPNQTDGWTKTGPSRNIYRASIMSHDKNLVYLCVGHPTSLKMVPLDRRHNFLFFVPLKYMPVKNWVVRYWHCLEWGADLHMAQLMPLPLTVSRFNEIQIDFTFLVAAYPGSPGKRAVKRVCVCEVYAYLPFPRYGVSKKSAAWIHSIQHHVVKIWSTSAS